jgi:hypothetical protein
MGDSLSLSLPPVYWMRQIGLIVLCEGFNGGLFNGYFVRMRFEPRCF